MVFDEDIVRPVREMLKSGQSQKTITDGLRRLNYTEEDIKAIMTAAKQGLEKLPKPTAPEKRVGALAPEPILPPKVEAMPGIKPVRKEPQLFWIAIIVVLTIAIILTTSMLVHTLLLA